ncbi:hemerythrin isoform A [Chlorella sorokiniana]|uniref:Hemerythrin isoform A n=1 Tax=Chlorella sorokiniana TaxID=3076 RepID=A0A2P6TU72_CHLSO|nr:hemerythrin isoform B [Chlorella sorokiniana]PRW57610.1 hemerythrin isoform A [Chlorella sorokiniana]|eukprot:PRW57609.1 hemerythrin isoform B [Chlorella sorokiniana]
MAAKALQDPTIIDAVVADHRNVTAMIARCLQATKDGDHDLAASLATAVTVDVLLHSRAEEAVLYPFMEGKLGKEGHSFTEHSNREHAELEGKLVAAVLAGREGDWTGMAQQMGEAEKAFEHHRHDEEDKYLPKLAQASQAGELRELTAQWAEAKRKAPLRELSGPLAKSSWETAGL